MIFVKSQGKVINGLVFLTLSEQEVIFIDLIGNIHPEFFDTVIGQPYEKNHQM